MEILIYILTGFLWSFGAEISLKIKDIKEQKYHASPIHFWGFFHRFNRFILGLVESENEVIQLFIQAFLAPLFFSLFCFILGAYKPLIYLSGGGLLFILFKILRKKINERD